MIGENEIGHKGRREEQAYVSIRHGQGRQFDEFAASDNVADRMRSEVRPDLSIGTDSLTIIRLPACLRKPIMAGGLRPDLNAVGPRNDRLLPY
jgi:hypothetical protein